MNGFEWGGSEELWWATAQYAHSEDHKVSIVAFRNDSIHEKFKTLERKGIKIFFVDKEREVILPALIKRAYLKIGRRPVNIQYENRFDFINQLKPDYILLSQGSTLDITYIEDLQFFFEKSITPFSVICQHHSENGSVTKFQKDYIKPFFKKAQKVFFVAKRNKEVIERQLAYKLNNACVIKNPVNLIDKRIVPWPIISKPSFAVVARLQIDAKGQDILLQALSSEKWKQRDFTVNFFGTGSDLMLIKELILFYGLDGKVNLKGHQRDIKKIWEENHLLLLASLSEGTPLSQIEAMICGRPCLVTDVGDCASYIEDNQNGWVVYTASVRALDEALERAWIQQNDWKEMGSKAHETVKEFIGYEAGACLFNALLDDYVATVNT